VQNELHGDLTTWQIPICAKGHQRATYGIFEIDGSLRFFGNPSPGEELPFFIAFSLEIRGLGGSPT
jgi:hypothetical protein